ncbi:hypothetical protein [Bacillus sp. FJAT-45350]|uniref:hypothetical protein n=1 Tax=Bacillus sp. FJAT-45350 TaxID=2011014 RepID=UPI000BB6F371|nr:hypothetical protein [Bacillus sp. FJAT-45350]
MGEWTNKIGSLFAREINERTEQSQQKLISEFGTITTSGSLLLDSFPEPIPKHEYQVLEHVFITSGKRVFCIPTPSGSYMVIGGFN